MKASLLPLVFLPFLQADGQSAPAFRSGQTVGTLPYLEFGPGDDRLGGAKMGYLDSLVSLKVVDSLGGDYIVALSKSHRAFIPKGQVRLLPAEAGNGHRLTGSWKVHGDDRYDYVSVALPERLPYRSQMRLRPATIVVDIFGATSNTNWVTQLSTARSVRNAWYEQVEDDVMRVHIELAQERHWGYSVGYDSTGSRLTVRVKRPPSSLDIRQVRIAVDAGHGGGNSGASGGTSGILEKEYTLKIALALEKELRRMGNRRVFMTRDRDTSLDMPERTLMLRREDPDLLVSIHLNSSSNKQVGGTSTYYRHIGFRPLSQAILSRMLTLGLKEFGNIGHFNFALSGPTEYPNCLVEVAFLSHEPDERRILDPRFHREAAKRIAMGIRDWLRQREDGT